MYNEKELLEKAQDHITEGDIKLLTSLIEEIDMFNTNHCNKFVEVYIDFDNIGNDSEFDPYETFSLKIRPVNTKVRETLTSQPVITSNLTLQELDASICVLDQYFEETQYIVDIIDKGFLEDNETLCSTVQLAQDDGYIVYQDIEGYKKAKIEEFAMQPIDGQLYDLNRLPEVIYSLKDKDKSKYNQSWVNDIALVNLCKYYYEKCNELEGKLKLAEDKLVNCSIH